jgi:hypothetical protein
MNEGSREMKIRERISAVEFRRPRTAIMIVFSILAVSTIVWASIPDEAGVINGCSDKLTGLARIIDTSRAQCLPTETKVSWNQAGQPGPVGPAGPQGIQGIPGPVGPAGATFKAAALVDAAQGGFQGAIVRCQNNVTGDTTPPCGFKLVQTLSAGDPTIIGHKVSFGFQVDDRFVSTTPFSDDGLATATVSRNPFGITSAEPDVWWVLVHNGGAFFIYVY